MTAKDLRVSVRSVERTTGCGVAGAGGDDLLPAGAMSGGGPSQRLVQGERQVVFALGALCAAGHGGPRLHHFTHWPGPGSRAGLLITHRMPMADCSIRSGDSVAALLRWLPIQAPSLCSRSCWSLALPPIPSAPMTVRSMCSLGT
ncbi:hypothetical protein [Streptomyces sp. NPDC008121]|uniref:hypothetical protein n=1 Tax=Streptomyces sp. NPDC008121 TaxID=3364809 RepID=UPI0036E9D89A